MATYNFSVRAQDETGAFSDRDFAIQVRNNLVDRLLAIDSNNAYASVDGTTWTERTGKGGAWCRNLLGKWIVCTSYLQYYDDNYSNCGQRYRISDDTINWTEEQYFWLSNDAPVYDENDVEIQAAGPLYHQYFYPTRDQFTVINGKIIIPSIVDGKLMIVYSNDAINWYAYESTKTSNSSNTMGIQENALYITGDLSTYMGKARHGLSNVVMHNGKYTMINNHTATFYQSDDLIDWTEVAINNESDLGRMNYAINKSGADTGYSFYNTDIMWYLLSVNNVLWMLGQNNQQRHYSSSSIDLWYTDSYSYVFYTTNLTDINYSSNYYRQNSQSYETTAKSTTMWERNYYYPSASSLYDSSSLNSEHRNIYYANGVIFAYCGKDIVTTKTLSNNTRQSTGINDNRLNTISGSCFFEGDIYYAYIGANIGYGVKKLSIDNSEYGVESSVAGLPNSITDITSV